MTADQLDMVKRMVECPPNGVLTPDFMGYIDRIIDLTAIAGGQLFSRQATALAIATWELLHDYRDEMGKRISTWRMA